MSAMISSSDEQGQCQISWRGLFFSNSVFALNSVMIWLHSYSLQVSESQLMSENP